MRSRLSWLGRVRRIALGALALASCVATASALAQQAATDALGLRDETGAPATPMGAPAEAGLGPSASDETNPATQKKKSRPKGAPKSPA